MVDIYTHANCMLLFSISIVLQKISTDSLWMNTSLLWVIICMFSFHAQLQASSLSETYYGFFTDVASHFIYFGSRACCHSCKCPSSSLPIQEVRHDRKGIQIYLAHFIYCIPQVGLGSGFSVRISDFSFTNSLATSSLVLCDSILRMVHPVSSIWIRLPSDSQHAHEPCSTMSLSCITATPTRRSSRAKQ